MKAKYFKKINKEGDLCYDEKSNKNINYKKKYYSLIRELSQTHTMMCERCPLVKSCCGGCNLLKSKIQKIKREQNEN